jgi:AcrR family transcriptional regulator
MTSTETSRKREGPEARRRAIIDEAIVAIGERGYFGFTIQDLAQRCGLTNGGLLYHFKTKEELFLAVLVEYERRTELNLVAVAQQFSDEGREGTSRTIALALLRGMVEHSASEPELMRLFAVVQAEALHRAHPAHDYFSELQGRIMAGLGAIVRGLTPEPEVAARAIYAMMIGLEYQWLRTDGAFDYLAEWDRAVVKLLPEDDKGER